MFRSDLYGRVPGFSSAAETYESVVSWGKEGLAVVIGAIINGTARDAGNTPTTVLRPGLLLGQITSSGELKEYNPAGTDGSEQVYGILLSGFRMQDLDANNVNRFVWVLVGGPVQASKLILLDNQARRQMANRFLLDDDILGRRNGGYLRWRREQAKTANYTVVANDAGTLFTNTGAAGAVTFTLPALAVNAGPFGFLVAADQNVTVASAAANQIIAFNNAAASSLAFSTVGSRIGGFLEFYTNVAGTKWHVENHSQGNAITVA